MLLLLLGDAMTFSRQVRRLRGEAVPVDWYASCANRAFSTYEPWILIFGTNVHLGEWQLRCTVWQAVFQRQATAYVCDATCDGDVVGCAAVALLLRQTSPRPYSAFEKVRAGLLAAPLRLGITATRRVLATGAAIGAMQAADTAGLGEHLFLSTVAVIPACQRRGLASGVLRAVLEDADAARLPVYLYTANDRNEAMYAKHGFVRCSTVELERDDASDVTVVMRGMIRAVPPAEAPH